MVREENCPCARVGGRMHFHDLSDVDLQDPMLGSGSWDASGILRTL